MLALVMSVAVWLGYDYVTHSFSPYIRWRMKRKLREGPRDEALPKPPAHTFSARCPTFGSGLPVLVLGHTGSGKSTLLGQLARDFKSRGIPVAHFRFRALDSDNSSSVDAQTFSSAAVSFFDAIGYPKRPSLLSRLSFRQRAASHAGVNIDVEVEDAWETVAHFQRAVSDLFSVCIELYGERSHLDLEDRAPIIIADELQDLVRNNRVKQIGGETIFRQLAAEFTSYCTDAKSVRFCAAASSFALQDELNDTRASGFRVMIFTTSDPPAADVVKRLCAIGIKPTEAELITATCGTRLRALSPFLDPKNGASLDVAKTLKTMVGTARINIDKLFGLLDGDKESRRVLAGVMDDLCAGKEGVSVKRLPKQLRKVPYDWPSAASVLYLGSGKTLEIQSQVYCVAWKEMRREFFKPNLT